ncbi:hypothetical protein JK361_07785 [Streptomyces sp. 5-8]|uniref:SH3b domain-containing protein n=1 Tax=Streptomyces musisoli TaxID=2802280 RepID=A0ABS1NWM9_9ACTN|nr:MULTISPECIES: hypothetical protein [Streptomyces]MBL1104498.1 hypothetical protein [Streptomyces musisoli]MBY8840470.1 hypothetical protein [Streptomyces sp. SP2-10]
MRNSLRFRYVASLVAAAALGLAVPGTAGAAHRSAESARFTSGCPTGEVVAVATVYVRTQPKTTAPVLEKVAAHDWRYCYFDSVKLGDRYDACGHRNANGWIHIATKVDNRWGWSAMTCWNDV